MPAHLQPHLGNANVSLRPLMEEDRAPLYSVAKDPLIWEQHPAHDRWQTHVFNSFFDDCLASGGGLVALDPKSGAIIGASRYDTGRVSAGEVEIGWTFLARSHWGTLTNPSMKALMIAHALQHYERTLFLIGENNRRSRRAVEKIGALLTPRIGHGFLAGQPAIHVIYAIDGPAFKSGPIAHLA